MSSLNISTADPVLGCYLKICAFSANKVPCQEKESVKPSAISTVVIVSTFPGCVAGSSYFNSPTNFPKTDDQILHSVKCKPAKQIQSGQNIRQAHKFSQANVLNWGFGEHWCVGHCANSTKKLCSQYKTRSKIRNG